MGGLLKFVYNLRGLRYDRILGPIFFIFVISMILTKGPSSLTRDPVTSNIYEERIQRKGSFGSVLVEALCYKPKVVGSRPDAVYEVFQFT
jgi:hypothetical protein